MCDPNSVGKSRSSCRYCVSAAVVLLFVGGCSIAYRTPGGGANLKLFADRDIREIFQRQPSAPRPVHLATARVQEPRYRSYSSRGVGRGRYSVVTVRDVEQEQDFKRIANLPEVAQVVPLNRLLLSDQLESDRELRQAAAALHADMILVYTFDTDFFIDDALRPLTVVTLGLSPNKQVRVSTTASAILMDVRTGYVYGACESTARRKQLASTWTSRDAVDRSRRKTERQAFEDLLDQFEKLWKGVANDLLANAGERDSQYSRGPGG